MDASKIQLKFSECSCVGYCRSSSIAVKNIHESMTHDSIRRYDDHDKQNTLESFERRAS